MAAPDYAAKRKELAVRIGLGRKPGQGARAEAEAAPKAQSKAAPTMQSKVDATPARRRKLGVAFD